MGRLYDAFIEVGPRFAGFSDIRKQGDQAGKEYGKALADAAVKAAKANVGKLGEALAKARSTEADAAGKVRVAETQLGEARKKYGTASSQAVAAEERLAAAQRKSATAASTAKTAAESLDKARDNLSKTADSAGASAGGRFSHAFKGSMSKIGGEKEGKQFASRFGVGMNGAIGGIVSRSAGVFVAGFAAIKSAQVFSSFINDARESAKVGRVSAQVVKSTGGAAKVSAKQMGDLAGAISNKTGADDEAIQSGENLLATFTNVRNETGKGNKIFDRATQAAVDMASAMNNGVVDANGLKAANIQLGKALNDPVKGVTALQKVGVSFTADQKKQIKTLVESGDTLKAQKIILDEVGKEFGGAAAAATDPLTKLHTILGNVSETIGGVFLPYVDKAATWLGKNLPGAVATAGKFFDQKLLPPIKTVVSFVKDQFIPGLEGIYNLLVKHDFSREFSKAFHVQEDSGIVAFLLGINEGVRTAAANAKKWAGQIITGLTGGFKTGDWTGLGSALGGGITAGIKGIGSTAGKILDALGAVVDKIDWSALGGRIGKGLSDLLKSIDWKGLGAAVGDAISTVFQKASALSDKVGKAFKDLMTSVDWKKIGRESTDAIGHFIEGVDWGHLAKMLGVSALKSLKFDYTVYTTITNSAAELVIGMAQEIGKAIGKWFGDAGSWLKQKGADLIDGFTSGASDKASGIGSWLSDHVIAPVVNAFTGAGSWLKQRGKDLISGLKDGIWSFAKGLDDWMIRAPVAQLLAPWYGAGRWLIQNGKDLITGLKNGIAATAKSIGGWLAGNVINPTVSAFAKAGTWLVQHGKNLVAGFKNGITSVASAIGRWAYDHVIVPVVTPFGKAAGWLGHAGTQLVAGLLSGILADMRGIGSWIKRNVVDPVVTAVKHFFGIRSPSTVFAGIGGHLVAGLMKGLSTTSGTAIAKKVFGDMPSALRSIVGKGLISVANLPSKALDALGSSVGIGQPIGGPKGHESNVGIVRTLAAQYGWGSGAQWNALQSLIMGESGFNSNAQNPTSSAYGLFQFLDSTWGSVGASKTSDPWAQTIAGLRYIARSYGSPANAYGQWSSRSPHWYKKGTPWVPDDQLAFLHKGEGVIPAEVNKARLSAGSGGLVELGPKSIAALAQALASLSINIDGRSLDAALSGTAMGRGY